MATKCANPNCSHKTITNNEYCSICRMKNKQRHKCSYEGCENTCVKEKCRAHAHKLIRCTHIKPDGTQCENMGRGELCCRHTEKAKVMRNKFRNKYRKYDPVKTKIKNREKRIEELRRQLDELKALNQPVVVEQI